jgi:hypothetical protein
MKKRIAILAAIILVLTGGASLLPKAVAGEKLDRVTICHATASETNPYVVETVDKNSIVFGDDGHGNSGVNIGDIIPPFDYGDGLHYDGHNWDATGQAIFNNDCNLPVTPPPCTDDCPPPTTTPPTLYGLLTVIKTVDNSASTTASGTLQAIDFPLFVDGQLVVTGVPTTTTVGIHVATETPDSNYVGTFSGDCDLNGNVTVSTTTPAICLLLNTFILSTSTPATTTPPCTDDCNSTSTPPGGGGGGCTGDCNSTSTPPGGGCVTDCGSTSTPPSDTRGGGGGGGGSSSGGGGGGGGGISQPFTVPTPTPELSMGLVMPETAGGTLPRTGVPIDLFVYTFLGVLALVFIPYKKLGIKLLDKIRA